MTIQHTDSGGSHDRLAHCPQKVAAIIRAVCARNDVSVGKLIGGRKTRAVTRARWDACAELRGMERRCGTPSYPKIAEWLVMDHSSVIYACRAVADGREPAQGMEPR
jgi:chromosomal replication initiation ATPase DnaA